MLTASRRLPAIALLLSLLACGSPAPPAAQDTTPAGSTPGTSASAPQASGISIPETATPEPAASEATALVLFLGDSLTAGYGLSEEQAYPARVDELLAERGIAARIVNAGVSGDTTAGGLARLDWLLRQKPDVVVVALGANDGLRGLDPSVTEENLRQILERCQAAGARVLLAGMQMPPNYGADYQRRFAALYPELAAEKSVPLIPFLLEGVGGIPKLNQADGIHPTAEGQEIVAHTVADALDDLLR
jgi:acyl-CoA thioesterase-1